MKVLITGAAGMLGWNLARRLAGGHELVLTDVRQPDAPVPGAAFIQADLRDREAMITACRGVGAVVHAGAIPGNKPPFNELIDINLIGTVNVLDGAAEAGAQRFVYISSVCAYGIHSGSRPLYMPIDEEHPLLPRDHYSLSKVMAEQACAAHVRRTGRGCVVVRPTFIGDTEHYAGFRRRFAQRGFEPTDLADHVDVRDCCALIELALGWDGREVLTVHATAADALAPVPTRDVIRKKFGDVPIREEELSEQGPIFSLHKAAKTLGYEPKYDWRSRP